MPRIDELELIVRRSRVCPPRSHIGVRLFHKWELVLVGPPDTPYEGGIFKAMMQFPDDFPNSPPEMQFISKMYHPNGPCALRLTYARVSHALVLVRVCAPLRLCPLPLSRRNS